MTAASTGQAVADRLATLSLAVPVAAGQVRPGQQVPYVLVHDRLPATREPMGDNGADDTVTELVQVDVVQLIRTADWQPADPLLADAVAVGLNGCALPTAPYRVSGVHVQDVQALPDSSSPNILRTVVTVRVRRSLRRLP